MSGLSEFYWRRLPYLELDHPARLPSSSQTVLPSLERLFAGCALSAAASRHKFAVNVVGSVGGSRPAGALEARGSRLHDRLASPPRCFAQPMQEQGLRQAYLRFSPASVSLH